MNGKSSKRIFDVLLSGFSLIVLSPLFLIIPILIRIDSKGPIFYKQERLGKNGLVFNMIKFRTMVLNAEKMGTGLINYKDDPRVTRVGSFLRKFSIDELPQFLNVLFGDMSLVGPRPPVSYELGDYKTLNSRYKKRFCVSPGITGLAQVSGRNEISWDEKVEYDNKYINLLSKYGIWIDIKILFKTVSLVFRSKHIYEEKENSELDDKKSAVLAAEDVIAKAHAPEDQRFCNK